MKQKLLIIVITFLCFGFSSQAQELTNEMKYWKDPYPFQQPNITKEQAINWINNTPNSTIRRFTGVHKSPAAYRIDGKRDVKEAKKFAESKKAASVDVRPKNQKGYERRYKKQQKNNKKQ